MDESTDRGESEGWEPEGEEGWIFDLPDDVWQQKQTKHRDLRARLLRNVERAKGSWPSTKSDEPEASDETTEDEVEEEPQAPAQETGDPTPDETFPLRPHAATAGPDEGEVVEGFQLRPRAPLQEEDRQTLADAFKLRPRAADQGLDWEHDTDDTYELRTNAPESEADDGQAAEAPWESEQFSGREGHRHIEDSSEPAGQSPDRLADEEPPRDAPTDQLPDDHSTELPPLTPRRAHSEPELPVEASDEGADRTGLSDRWGDLFDSSDRPGSIIEGMRAWVEKSRARSKATRDVGDEEPAAEGEEQQRATAEPTPEPEPEAVEPRVVEEPAWGDFEEERTERPAAESLEPEYPTVESQSPEFPSFEPPAAETVTGEPPSEEDSTWETPATEGASAWAGLEMPAAEASDELETGDTPATQGASAWANLEVPATEAAEELETRDEELPGIPRRDRSRSFLGEDDDWGGEIIGEPETPLESLGLEREEEPAADVSGFELPSAQAEEEPDPFEASAGFDHSGTPQETHEADGPSEGSGRDWEPAEDDWDSDERPEPAGDELLDGAPSKSDLDDEWAWREPDEEEGVLVRAFNAHAAAASAREAEQPIEQLQDEEPSFTDILGEDADALLAEVSDRPSGFQSGAEDWGHSYRSAPEQLSPSELMGPHPDGPHEDELGVAVAAAQPARPAQTKGHGLVRSVVETTLLALLVFLAVRASFQNFRVDGNSMDPTLADGEFLLVNKLVYAEIDMGKLAKFVPFIDAEEDEKQFVFHGPHRGDIVVLRDPRRPDQDLIKRIIGLPGETVEIRNGSVYIDEYLLDEPYITSSWNDTRPRVAIPEGHYYVLGDNRNNSLDSRSTQVGLIPKSLIIGKALLTYWPFDRFGLAPNSPGTSGGPEITTTRIADTGSGTTLTVR